MTMTVTTGLPSDNSGQATTARASWMTAPTR